jgi:hypothetical protein
MCTAGSAPAPTSLDKVDREWVATQVLQTGRMLVGGTAVLGVYAVSKEAGRRAVEALQRLWPTDVKEPDSLVFLHLSSDSSQFTARAGPSRVSEPAQATNHRAEGVVGT